jgi:hypothetical protein
MSQEEWTLRLQTWILTVNHQIFVSLLLGNVDELSYPCPTHERQKIFQILRQNVDACHGSILAKDEIRYSDYTVPHREDCHNQSEQTIDIPTPSSLNQIKYSTTPSLVTERTVTTNLNRQLTCPHPVTSMSRWFQPDWTDKSPYHIQSYNRVDCHNQSEQTIDTPTPSNIQ